MALGSGLDALFEDNTIESKDVQTLRMSEIEPNKSQPRKDFDDEAIMGLAESIRQHGLIQPIIVRPMPNGMTYQIVAGERRWRACRILGMSEVPVIVRELDDFEVSQIAVIENVQRADLNPIEEAMAYKELISTYGMTQDTVAKAIGKSRPYIANALRLLTMPDEVQRQVRVGEISVGHAKALMSIVDKNRIGEALDKVLMDNLNVRQTEKLAANINTEDDPGTFKFMEPEEKKLRNFYTEMELSLHEKLGRKVKISGKSGEKGTISIDFFDKEDLYRISTFLIMMETGELPPDVAEDT